MGDQDWLDKGHGGGEGLRSMIRGSTEAVAERASIRNVLRGSDAAGPRASRRRTKALVGWLLYCFTAVGGTAAAFTVRDTLFPSLGAPTRAAIWANSSDTTLASEHGSSSTEGKEATLEAITVPATTASTLASSIEAQPVPASSASNEGPDNSVDHRGPGSDGPATGTTVVGPSSSGPGPGTTVDDHPTERSTPGSVSTPTSADATPTSASTPGPSATDPGQQSGKGGGGGGSPGGPPPSTP
ncbi:MAG: hypothetical protein ABI706_14645 [Ilumatobacteraceae bacterium]